MPLYSYLLAVCYRSNKETWPLAGILLDCPAHLPLPSLGRLGVRSGTLITIIMELPLDIHTHRAPEVPSQAIVNIRFPEPFCPEPGRYYSLGIHPWDVHLIDEELLDWDLFTKQAAHPQVLAIGECGMDKKVNKDLLLRQECIFSEQLRIARRLQKPIIVHNVRSSGFLRLSKDYSNFSFPWIQHGFRGSAQEASRAWDYRFILSFGPKYDEEALRSVSLDRLLLETDDSGVDIHEVYRRVAATLEMPVEELIARVQQNIQRVFFNQQEL